MPEIQGNDALPPELYHILRVLAFDCLILKTAKVSHLNRLFQTGISVTAFIGRAAIQQIHHLHELRP